MTIYFELLKKLQNNAKTMETQIFTFSFFRLSNNCFTATVCGVGLKDGRVRDQDITVSRNHNSYYQYRFARLDRQGTHTQYGGWLACANPCGKNIFIIQYY